MVSFPNVKINLGLNVLSKREDGYHNLQSIFYPVDLCDVLEIVPSKEFKVEISGEKIEGDVNQNLVVKAYNLIKEIKEIPPVEIYLFKKVPTGAGLGAGSSNAVFALNMLNQLFDLNLTADKLYELALKLGSDCPFFLQNRPALITGRGEIINSVELTLKGYYIKIVHPGIHMSTKEAFAGIKPLHRNFNISDFENLKPEGFAQLFTNDFEKVFFALHPNQTYIKNQMLEEGALYASMTGSGSAFYGIYHTEPKPSFPNKFEFISILN